MPITINVEAESDDCGSGGEKTPRKLSEEELKLMVESGYSNKAIELYVNNVNVGKLESPLWSQPFSDHAETS